MTTKPLTPHIRTTREGSTGTYDDDARKETIALATEAGKQGTDLEGILKICIEGGKKYSPDPLLGTEAATIALDVAANLAETNRELSLQLIEAARPAFKF